MATVHVLDNYYLAITALVTIAYQLLFFSIAYTFKFDKLTDLAGGSNFAVLAILTLSLSGQHHARQVVASLFLIIWAVRLSGFLFFRILKTGSDDRFDDKRDKFFPFLGFWVFQMLWVWTVSLPVTVLNSPNVTQYPQHSFGTGRDIAGIVLFVIGFLMEAVSDVQKYRFRQSHDKRAVCNKGLFAVSRHPNYFGEIIIQFSIYMIAVSSAADGYVSGQAYKALYATILGPFFLTILLMFVSGLPLSERPKAKSRYEKGNNWFEYEDWLQRTSILIPFPPQLYAKMPVFLKRSIFLEFPMYVFDPVKHSDHSFPGGASETADERGRRGGDERLA
ncbi:3-oxo-5-alpha-steroid 4-dehydrogenase [Ophiocordyceps camponoti-floridani]|uniref:3-oxo-5-alpha-steroid 4-dehydrogenase n=1 Tax=Ophiocordyceps camponoti-floridani TaxID=2030778 RepID=A0A8H4Q7Z9_9HYPO|nr:3-oxo-5-alpha-steroid 4-dehydrogenase [Ophiocordyceps camponoti-floridani]